MKALYLDGSCELDVRLDGPALRVCRPGRSDGRYPLPRVARVIAVGRVRWQPGALVACLTAHKPIAVLDRRGRFVRVLFRPASPRHGLARHFGELLSVPRFWTRYEQWFHAAEEAGMRTALLSAGIRGRSSHPDAVWKTICSEQHRRWRVRTGLAYRYLLGLAAAQIASEFLLAGLPRDPRNWTAQEYRFFGDMLRLERWNQVALLDQVLSDSARQPERWELTAAFERDAAEREQRIGSWRAGALRAMMGLRPFEKFPVAVCCGTPTMPQYLDRQRKVA